MDSQGAFSSKYEPDTTRRFQASDLEVLAARYAATRRLLDKYPNPSEKRTRLVEQADGLEKILLEVALRY